MDFRGIMRFQHVELGRESFAGGECWKVLSMAEHIWGVQGAPKHGNFVSEFTLYSQFPAPVLGAGGSPGISNGHRSKGCDRLAAFTSV